MNANATKSMRRISGRAILVGLKKEMDKPRMTKSARESDVTLATPRIMKRKRGKAKA
jgi:hypothetical protein